MAQKKIRIVWRRIQRYPLYEFSSDGRARNVKTLRVLKLSYPRGYPMVSIHAGVRWGFAKKAKQLRLPLHQLICEAFHGPRPCGMWVSHNNGYPPDCRASNLRWDTPSGNHADKKRHGTNNHGERHGHAKLTDAQAQEVLDSPLTQRQAAEKYGLTQPTISYLRRGITWRHLKR